MKSLEIQATEEIVKRFTGYGERVGGYTYSSDIPEPSRSIVDRLPSLFDESEFYGISVGSEWKEQMFDFDLLERLGMGSEIKFCFTAQSEFALPEWERLNTEIYVYVRERIHLRFTPSCKLGGEAVLKLYQEFFQLLGLGDAVKMTLSKNKCCAEVVDFEKLGLVRAESSDSETISGQLYLVDFAGASFQYAEIRGFSLEEVSGFFPSLISSLGDSRDLMSAQLGVQSLSISRYNELRRALNDLDCRPWKIGMGAFEANLGDFLARSEEGDFLPLWSNETRNGDIYVILISEQGGYRIVVSINPVGPYWERELETCREKLIEFGVSPKDFTSKK